MVEVGYGGFSVRLTVGLGIGRTLEGAIEWLAEATETAKSNKSYEKPQQSRKATKKKPAKAQKATNATQQAA